MLCINKNPVFYRKQIKLYFARLLKIKQVPYSYIMFHPIYTCMRSLFSHWQPNWFENIIYFYTLLHNIVFPSNTDGTRIIKFDNFDDYCFSLRLFEDYKFIYVFIFIIYCTNVKINLKTISFEIIH